MSSAWCAACAYRRRRFADKAIADARERVVNLSDLLGSVPPLPEVKARVQQAFAEEFDVSFASGELSGVEQRMFDEALSEIDTPDWIHLVRKPRTDLPLLQASRKVRRRAAAGGDCL